MTPAARKNLIVGGAVAAGLVAAFGLGRWSKPVETRTEAKTEVRTVTLYTSHATTTTTDKGRVRIVTVTKKEPTGAVQTTRTEERAADLTLHSDWTGTESKRESAKAEATTVTRSSSPGWGVTVGALWSSPTPKPESYTLEVDRRIWGGLWLGVQGNTDKQFGANIRVEW